MQLGFETIREILEHRLHQEDIERLLHGLDEAGKAQLFFRITELLRRTSALADIANRVSDSLSLDVLFPRLMEVVTEALNADRSSLFLFDPETNELFSRVVQGDAIGEIRFPCHLGVAGSVFTSGQAEIIADAYADPRFNQDVDRHTGYRTRNILCVPIRNKRREVIGITQALNKHVGDFDIEDQRLLEGLSLQASAALENARLFEKVERQQREEAMLLEISISIVSEIHLDPLLAKILAAATALLDADRGSLFLYDAERDELFSRVAGGLSSAEIRFPANAGIAGECFTTGDVINIADAYGDSRFNPEFDRHTGYRTHSMLCMPIVPLAWLIPREPWQAALPSLLGGSGWAIYNVAAFNLLMEYAPPGNIPRYAATQQMTLLAASFIGPVIGTAIVAGWGIRTAIVVSAFGRFAAAGVMVLPVRATPETDRPREELY